ncbi:hypothetical protein [Ammoniphilus sp. CFH 90114]|uniref:hypothetical protein n=1 Tax=Ammoniphilus sp. CFH 90114 TaxID=2493665 RepID=UPI00100E364A|nr:hypothetical protein [Ammoniphilus sp. CFH 90114]RXT04139.1 hypothetical protein EIZ39_21405 [Ammoniphilus sp. CFH 90114]
MKKRFGLILGSIMLVQAMFVGVVGAEYPIKEVQTGMPVGAVPKAVTDASKERAIEQAERFEDLGFKPSFIHIMPKDSNEPVIVIDPPTAM